MELGSTELSVLWTLSSLLLDLLGNSYILYATTLHRAIKLDSLSVWIIKNLAVADLLNGVLFLGPVLITLFHNNTWVLGQVFCKTAYVYKYTFTIANMILMNFLSVNKLLRCIYPLRHRTSSCKHRLLVTLTTVVLSLLSPAWAFYGTFVTHTMIVTFSPAQGLCWSVYSAGVTELEKLVGYGLATLLNAVPCLALMVVNLMLVVFALNKTKHHIKKMNIVIVIMVNILFLCSMLPYFIYYMCQGSEWTNTYNVRVVTFTMFLSSFCNAPVYLMTNKTFRKFTEALLCRGRIEPSASSFSRDSRESSVRDHRCRTI